MNKSIKKTLTPIYHFVAPDGKAHPFDAKRDNTLALFINLSEEVIGNISGTCGKTDLFHWASTRERRNSLYHGLRTGEIVLLFW